MILCDCPRCGRRELRGPRSIHPYPTARGDVLAVACRQCGAEVAAASRRLLRPAALEAVA
ncbi:MAG: hypothetical protein Q8K72_02450 [Acidimicrobiales bacterium]|nr:hypothetical protein [Acidimicrobiales bacterium]